MKHETDHPENENPVIDAVFIGLYLVALVVLLIVLARRFMPAIHTIVNL